jgi:hypothetical protein
MRYSEGSYGALGTLAGILGVILAALSGMGAVGYAFGAWNWFAAEHQARIINREYGTNYTQTEVFWASNVIETVQHLERKRYEVDGDLVRGQEAAK